jgi:hypothetical protein
MFNVVLLIAKNAENTVIAGSETQVIILTMNSLPLHLAGS